MLSLPMLRAARVLRAIAVILAGVALGIQPLLGHAGAVGGNVGMMLIASEIMHLLAAGAWLGGLLPLFMTISILPHNAAATACRSFTPMGLSATVILAGTAVLQVNELMGGMPGLFGTGYGHVALVKLGLFFVLLTLAALNRLGLTNRLAGPTPDAARRHMRWSIAIETILGVAVVVTAGFLATHAPGTHEQPVWPFPWRPSGAVFAEPDLRGEVIAGARCHRGGCDRCDHGLDLASGALAGAGGGGDHRCVCGSASRSAAGGGLSDKLLCLTHRVCGHGDRAWRPPVRGELRCMSRR